jgi:hypothetical protein
VFLANLGGTQRLITAALTPVGFGTGAISLLSGVAFAGGSDGQMQAGFPVFFSSGLLLLVGFVDHWPRRRAPR